MHRVCVPVAAALGMLWAARRRRRQLEQRQTAIADLEQDGQPLSSHSAHPLVVVVGLGGVGSHAAHLLLRGGVRRLRLVDFDQVSLSSLNRHATAVRLDVGTPKARAVRDQLLRIAPDAQATATLAPLGVLRVCY